MEKELIQADLNLLKVLHVLLEERNVTRAADRLFVSQPALSKSLRRLRLLFGDPLLVRSPHGLVLTVRAEELVIPVKEAIEQHKRIWQTSNFEPAIARGVFRIAAPEPFLLGTIPKLVIRLQKVAPNLSLEVLHLMDDHLPMLAAGSLDFVIYADEQYPKGFISQPILTAVPKVWFRKGHPLSSKKRIDLKDTCAYPQVALHSPNVTVEDLRVVQQALVDAGLDYKVIMSTSHLLIALDILTKSDAIMLGPEYLSQVPAIQKDIASRSISEIPAFSHLLFKLCLIQHERTFNSAVHRWLADEIRNSYTEISP